LVPRFCTPEIIKREGRRKMGLAEDANHIRDSCLSARIRGWGKRG
jgi:hypothetical protein